MPSILFAHLTWTTFQRKALIDAAGESFLRRFLPAVARRYNTGVDAIGIVNDHVHLLLVLPPVIDIPRLIQGLKGASARIANRDVMMTGEKLRWASDYDLRSVSPHAVERVRGYVEAQGKRHPLDRTKPESRRDEG